MEVFKRKGVPISREGTHQPMGAHKEAHIRKISKMEEVAARWEDAHGRKPDEGDVETMCR